MCKKWILSITPPPVFDSWGSSPLGLYRLADLSYKYSRDYSISAIETGKTIAINQINKTIMNLEKAKKVLIDFQMKHENYLNAVKQYEDYKNLPFWKKWATKKVEAPERSHLYEVFPIYISNRGMMTIELRMYFSGTHKEITLAINEGNRGYKVDVNTGKKSYYLGKVNPVITESAEEILEDIRKELASLYIL